MPPNAKGKRKRSPEPTSIDTILDAKVSEAKAELDGKVEGLREEMKLMKKREKIMVKNFKTLNEAHQALKGQLEVEQAANAAMRANYEADQAKQHEKASVVTPAVEKPDARDQLIEKLRQEKRGEMISFLIKWEADLNKSKNAKPKKDEKKIENKRDKLKLIHDLFQRVLQLSDDDGDVGSRSNIDSMIKQKLLDGMVHPTTVSDEDVNLLVTLSLKCSSVISENLITNLHDHPIYKMRSECEIILLKTKTLEDFRKKSKPKPEPEPNSTPETESTPSIHQAPPVEDDAAALGPRTSTIASQSTAASLGADR